MGLARQRVLRLHGRPEVQHRRPGLPAVRVRPLADPARRPAPGGNQALPDRAGHQEEEGIEARQPRHYKLSGQIVIPTALLRTVRYCLDYNYFLRSCQLLYFSLLAAIAS